jgi:hypothetical protein
MWTGRQTLASIEQTIARLAEQEGDVDRQLRTLLADATRLRETRSGALRELARVKLDEIAAGRLVRNLDAAERRAVQILDSGRLRLAAEEERRTTALKEIEQAEAARHGAAARVEAALAEVEAVRAAAEQQVRTTPAWQALSAAVDRARSIADEAEKKAAQSRSDLGAKQRPYDDDKLFVYLWQRKFGTAEYRGGNFARLLDRKVADFIGYASARADYAMLIEIPKRLGEHSAGQRAALDAAISERAEVERTAMVAAGIEPKERALAEARHTLAAADAALEQRRAAFRSIDTARQAVIGDEATPGYSAALQTIAEGDAQDDIAALYAEARRTATPADEQLVRRIEQIDADASEVGRNIARLRRTAGELAERRLEVERARARFRDSGYDHPNVVFGNDIDIGRVLGQILEGAVRSGMLWDILRGGFGTRPARGRPEFGTPTFPFPFPMPGGGDNGPSGGGWRIPETQGGWFPPASSPSRRDKDDDDDDDDRGFRTGDSF